jgi:hypothetical protein
VPSFGILYLDKTLIVKPHDFTIIIEISCALAGTDPLGKVSGSDIILRCYKIGMNIASKDMLPLGGRLEMTNEEAARCYAILDSMQDIENIQPSMSVTCPNIMLSKQGHMEDTFRA